MGFGETRQTKINPARKKSPKGTVKQLLGYNPSQHNKDVTWVVRGHRTRNALMGHLGE